MARIMEALDRYRRRPRCLATPPTEGTLSLAAEVYRSGTQLREIAEENGEIELAVSRRRLTTMKAGWRNQERLLEMDRSQPQ